MTRTISLQGSIALFLAWVPALAGAQTDATVDAPVEEPEPRVDVAAAARAFAHAQAAELRGQHEEAARSYELAFHVAPTPEALRSAVRGWHRAGARARAATLAERLLTRYSDDEIGRQIAEVVLEDAQPVLARYLIACRPACTIAIDGRAGDLLEEEHHIGYVEPGEHRVELTWPDGRTASESALFVAASTLELELSPPARAEPVREEPVAPEPPPPPEPPAPAPARDPLEFVPFSVAVPTTVALGVASIALAVDVEQAADAYRRMPTREAYEEGLEREVQTNVLLGLTGAAAVATAIIAIFTDWDGPGADEQVWLRPLATPELALLELGTVMP